MNDKEAAQIQESFDLLNIFDHSIIPLLHLLFHSIDDFIISLRS